MKAYVVSEGIVPFIFILGTRCRRVVSFTSYPIYPRVEICRCPLDRRLVGPHCLSELDVCVTVHHRYNNINSQVDAKTTNFIDNYIQLNTFREMISPILRSTRLCLQLAVWCTGDAACCHQQAASPVHHTTSCKHSLVLLRMGNIFARNMLSWL